MWILYIHNPADRPGAHPPKAGPERDAPRARSVRTPDSVVWGEVGREVEPPQAPVACFHSAPESWEPRRTRMRWVMRPMAWPGMAQLGLAWRGGTSWSQQCMHGLCRAGHAHLLQTTRAVQWLPQTPGLRANFADQLTPKSLQHKSGFLTKCRVLFFPSFFFSFFLSPFRA